MSHAAEADELVEVAGDELRAVVGDHSGMSVGEFFPRSLEDDLDISLAIDSRSSQWTRKRLAPSKTLVR